MNKSNNTDQTLNDRFTKRGLSFDDRILHKKFVNYGLNAKEWTKKCVLLLPEIAKRKIWEKKGFLSIYEYAAKLAGMSRNKVDEALWILRKIEDKPELQQVVELKGIQSVKPVISITNELNAKFWAEKAREMSRDTLRVYVKELKKQSLENNTSEIELQNGFPMSKNNPDFRASPKTTMNLFDQQAIPNKEIITIELDMELAEKLRKLKGSGDWNDLLKQLIELREKQIESEKPESVKTNSRHIPIAIKRHVIARTNGSCTFPGCLKPAELLHHTKRFALHKAHDPDSIVPLCKAHERLAHLGLIENEGMSPENWKIREKPDMDYENSKKSMIDRIVLKHRTLFGGM
jgi:hypothetical protein